MCFYTIAFSAEDGDGRMFANLHTPVGPGTDHQSRKDDIMLVQYLLKTIFQNSGKFSPPLAVPKLKPLVIDGVLGPITFSWIKAFQDISLTRGNNVATDGRVDVSKTADGVSTISHTRYTILLLNLAYRKARSDMEAENLPNVDDCPMLVRQSLSATVPIEV